MLPSCSLRSNMVICSPRTPRDGTFSQLSKPSLAVLFPHKRKALLMENFNIFEQKTKNQHHCALISPWQLQNKWLPSPVLESRCPSFLRETHILCFALKCLHQRCRLSCVYGRVQRENDNRNYEALNNPSQHGQNFHMKNVKRPFPLFTT